MLLSKGCSHAGQLRLGANLFSEFVFILHELKICSGLCLNVYNNVRIQALRLEEIWARKK